MHMFELFKDVQMYNCYAFYYLFVCIINNAYKIKISVYNLYSNIIY